MELNIHGIAHDSVSVVTHHCDFNNRKIDRKESNNQICVVHNFSRFGNIMKHFRINLVMTNNMLKYET